MSQQRKGARKRTFQQEKVQEKEVQEKKKGRKSRIGGAGRGG